MRSKSIQDRINRNRGTKVFAEPRPFTLTFQATGTSYPLASEDAQRLIDGYPLLGATANRISLWGDEGACKIEPATLGGGSAFRIER